MKIANSLQKAKALKAKKEEGNTEFRLGNVQKAHDLYTEALEIDPLNKFTNSKLYFNRATVSSKVKKKKKKNYPLRLGRVHSKTYYVKFKYQVFDNG